MTSPTLQTRNRHTDSLGGMPRTDNDDVAKAAARWHNAQAAADRARAELIAAVQQASAAGTGERLLAEDAHVTRQTIRAWLNR
jgi:hypothetical protein